MSLLKDLEHRLVVKLSAILGGMITLAIAVVTALSRLKDAGLRARLPAGFALG